MRVVTAKLFGFGGGCVDGLVEEWRFSATFVALVEEWRFSAAFVVFGGRAGLQAGVPSRQGRALAPANDNHRA